MNSRPAAATPAAGSRSAHGVVRLVVAATAALALLWLWISWCRAPATQWNDLRLTAVFMAAKGAPVYHLPGSGVLSTWMYGPTPLWLWSTVLWARDAAEALLIAGATNIVLTVAALAAACWWWPVDGARPRDRLLAAALCCLFWPEPTFRFLQADNIAVAGGLIALLALARHADAPHRALPWLAALASVLAIGAKQTAAGFLLAPIVWLWLRQGRRAALAQVARTGLVGALLGGLAVHQFGWHELWFSAVTVPSRLPWTDDWADRARMLLPYLAAQWLLPALLLLAGRPALQPAWPALELPVLTWLFALPLGLAGSFTVGGTVNHLHGLQLLSPAALVAGLTLLGRAHPLAPALAGVAGLLVGTWKIATTDHVPLRPATEAVAELTALQRRDPGAVWLPWSPLVTYFAEGRFDHTEDGIYVRFITGHPVTLSHARAHLPPRFRAMILPVHSWGAAERLAPESSTESKIGRWRVIRWPAAEAGK